MVEIRGERNGSYDDNCVVDDGLALLELERSLN